MNTQQILDFNNKNITEFRSTGGKLAAFGDAPVLLLTTRGAKSGKLRTSPVMYLADDHDPHRVYVFASAAGSDTDPAWFNNLRTHPDDITVEIGSKTAAAHAEVLPEQDRARTYAAQADRYPVFASYQARTTRPIPVIALKLTH